MNEETEPKELDVLMLIRRWSKQLGKMAESDVELVLAYLNSKHGPK